MTPNWYADGQHLLALAGGLIFVAGQGLTFWRTLVIGQRQTALRTMVLANDKEILGELSAAQRSLEKVVAKITGGERRKSPPGAPIPTWANGGRGQRSTDGGARA